MRVVLAIESGPDRGQRRVLQPGDRVWVGQPGAADWGVGGDILLSDRHFVVECGQHVCRLRDADTHFGTAVNGARRQQAELRDGDRIVAGWTTFTVRVEPSAEPVPGPAAPAADPCLVARQLRAQPRSLYAILDAARDPKVLELLRASGEKYQSLYEGPEGEELAAFAPYLVELPPASPLLDRLVSEGWGH